MVLDSLSDSLFNLFEYLCSCDIRIGLDTAVQCARLPDVAAAGGTPSTAACIFDAGPKTLVWDWKSKTTMSSVHIIRHLHAADTHLLGWRKKPVQDVLLCVRPSACMCAVWAGVARGEKTLTPGSSRGAGRWHTWDTAAVPEALSLTIRLRYFCNNENPRKMTVKY